MRASKEGIEISKDELGALLYFAGKADFAAVKFRIDGKQKLVAAASDGKRGVECKAPGGDAERGEWIVPGSYLETLRRSLNKNRTELLIRVTSKGLKDAVLRGAASREAQQEIADLTNGTSTQVSMELLHKLAKEPQLNGSWFAVVPKQVNKALAVVSKAADGCPVTLFPPADSGGQVLFACSSEGGRWTGVLPPALVEGPGGEADEPEEEDETPGRPSKQPELPGTEEPADDEEADGDESGVVDDEYAEKLKTQKSPKKKAGKKSGKKAAKRAKKS
jgi:hypothetical protein